MEDFLYSSEKDWFDRYRAIRLSRSPDASPARAACIPQFRPKRHSRRLEQPSTVPDTSGPYDPGQKDQFRLPPDYTPPQGLNRLMQRRLGDWPVYSILLAVVSVEYCPPEKTCCSLSNHKLTGSNFICQLIPNHIDGGRNWAKGREALRPSQSLSVRIDRMVDLV